MTTTAYILIGLTVPSLIVLFFIARWEHRKHLARLEILERIVSQFNEYTEVIHDLERTLKNDQIL